MDSALDKIEGAFTGLGLGKSPLARGAFGFVVGSVLSEAIEPSISYTSNGQRRPWAVLNSDKDATMFPWWSWGVLGAAAFGLFI